MLDLSLVEAVAAVVREGSFERAARVLHVTPSAVSQRVRLLEERLGTVLVVRGQPCGATPAGERLCRHAELVGMLEADLRRELPAVEHAGAGAGRTMLRIAVNADSLGTWFVGAMATFAERQPGLLDVAVNDEDHTAEWLRRGQVLAAVTSTATPVQGCRSRRLGSLRYAATAAPAFVRRWFPDGVTPAALAAAPSLRFDHHDGLQRKWARLALRRELEPPAHQLPSTTGFVNAVLAGLGWGMNPLALVQPHLRAGRLVELVPGLVLDVPLYWQSARLPVPMLDELTRCVMDAAARGLMPA